MSRSVLQPPKQDRSHYSSASSVYLHTTAKESNAGSGRGSEDEVGSIAGNISDHEGYGDSEGEGLGSRGSGGEDLESKDSSDSEGSNNEGNPAVKVRSQAVGAGAAAVPLSLMEKFRG